MPHSDYFIPEGSPIEEARGHGRATDDEYIPQFGGGSMAKEFQSVFGERN